MKTTVLLKTKIRVKCLIFHGLYKKGYKKQEDNHYNKEKENR